MLIVASRVSADALGAEVDAMDQAAVDVHADQVVEAAGRIDISFNAIGYRVVQNQPLVDISLEDFISPHLPTRRYCIAAPNLL
jgi:3-oxoacyl-[acyl-carrier protein] reductase